MSGRTGTVLRSERLEAREVPAAAALFAVGAGAGGGPRVQVFDTGTGARLGDFFAYEPSFTGGVTTAVADVSGDGRPDVVVGSGDGGAPRIRVFDGRAFDLFVTPAGSPLRSNPPVIADFFAYESSFRNGVFVGAGNIVGLGFAEVVAGAGPGGGPRVRVFDGQRLTGLTTAFTGELPGDVVADFFAYDASTRGGVRVAVATTPQLSAFAANVVTAPGPDANIGPQIRYFNGFVIGTKRTAFTGTQVGDVVADFFDGQQDDHTGRFVSAADVSRDGIADIATGTGAGQTPRVTVYNGSTIQSLGLSFGGRGPGDVFDTFIPAGDGNYQNGVTVGGATLTAGLGANLLYGVGGAGRLGETVGLRYTQTAAGVARQTVYDQVFDPAFLGGVFVST